MDTIIMALISVKKLYSHLFSFSMFDNIACDIAWNNHMYSFVGATFVKITDICVCILWYSYTSTLILWFLGQLCMYHRKFHRLIYIATNLWQTQQHIMLFILPKVYQSGMCVYDHHHHCRYICGPDYISNT